MNDPNSTHESVVIVGNGMVSHRFCDRLTLGGADRSFKITVLGEEPTAAYDRVHLTKLLAGASLEELLLAGPRWYEERGIDLRVGDPVVGIDARRRAVQTKSGVEVDYDRLVLATGASPWIPPVPGLTGEGVFAYRTADDLAALGRAAGEKHSAVVLGGGVLGLEVAVALVELGLSVTVIEPLDRLMARQLDDPRAADFLRDRLRQAGIDVRLQAKPTRVERCGDTLRIHMEEAQSVETDLIVVAAGIRPRDELAKVVPLRCASRGGFEITERMETSEPGIYAIGECASLGGVAPGLVAPGYSMADSLAAAFREQGEGVYKPLPPECDLKGVGIEVARVGEVPIDAESYVHSTASGIRVLQVRGGEAVGVTCVGPWSHANRARSAVRGRAHLSRSDLRRFERSGRLPARVHEPIALWPEARAVCNCMALSRGDLSRAMTEAGCCTAGDLTRVTGAGSMCGSCVPLLEELVGAPGGVSGPRKSGRHAWTFAASLAGAAAVLVALFVAPPAFANSVQSRWHSAEILWREGWLRQTTGFTILGISVFASLLAARKRLSWFRWGEFALHRAVHTTLGFGALAVLVAHTGLRMGNHLNFVLMTLFLVLCAIGAATGVVSYLETRQSGMALAARRIRPWLARGHLLTTWPMAIVLGFHILSAYYF